MEYQVPQFIEVEDKLIGPLTLRQFIYIAGAAGLCVILFAYLSILFAVLFAIPVVALASALAFYKVNGKPFLEVLEDGFNYYTRSKLFLWKHGDGGQKAPQSVAPSAPVRASRGPSTLTRGKLSELAWSLDIRKNAPSSGGEKN